MGASRVSVIIYIYIYLFMHINESLTELILNLCIPQNFIDSTSNSFFS